MATLVDERGRILVPKEMRKKLGLESGVPVIIEMENDRLTVRRAIPRRQALKRLAGVVPKSAGPPPMDPLDAKRMWEHQP